MQVVGLRKAGPPHSTQDILNPQKLVAIRPKASQGIKVFKPS